LDKLIAEALPLLEAPPAVRLVHLCKLLCGGILDRSYSNALPIRAFLRQETGKTSMERFEGSFVADAPPECGVRPISAAQVGPSEAVSIDLSRNRPTFLQYDDELHHAQVSLLLNKKDGSQFGLVRRGDGARHFLNSVRKLSDQVSCFPNYKVVLSMSLLLHHILS
jgi:hypothetical protein